MVGATGIEPRTTLWNRLCRFWQTRCARSSNTLTSRQRWRQKCIRP